MKSESSSRSGSQLCSRRLSVEAFRGSWIEQIVNVNRNTWALTPSMTRLSVCSKNKIKKGLIALVFYDSHLKLAKMLNQGLGERERDLIRHIWLIPLDLLN